MAVEKIVYFTTNILGELSTWNLENSDIDENNYVTIHSSGNISTSVSTEEYMVASKYRKVNIQLIDEGIDDTYNYQNLVVFKQELKYIDPNSERTSGTTLTPVINYNKKVLEDGTIDMTSDIAMVNDNLESCDVEIYNKTDHDIIIKAVSLYRSNDLTGQLGGDTGGGQDRPTKLSITCSHNNWTLDTVDDSMYFHAVIPVEDETYPPQASSTTYGCYFWQIQRQNDTEDGWIAVGRVGAGLVKDIGEAGGNLYAEGIRNGTYKIKLYINIDSNHYSPAQYPQYWAHQGEYYERTFTVKNCNPASLKITKTSINGYDGTPITIAMDTHPWITTALDRIEEVPNFSGCIASTWRPQGLPDTTQNRSINVAIGDTIDGGMYSLNREGGLPKSIVINGSGSVSLYGVYNGRSILKITTADPWGDATRDISEIIETINCGTDVEIVPDTTSLISLDQSVQFNMQSIPAGAPYVKTINSQGAQTWGWFYDNNKLVYLSSAPNNWENPSRYTYVIMKAKSDGVYTAKVSCMVEYGKVGQYKLVEKEISINIQAVPEPPEPIPNFNVTSSTGEFTLYKYNDNLVLKPPTYIGDLYLGASQSAIDGGSVTTGWDRGSQSIPVTARNVGKALITFSQYNGSEIFGNVLITMNYEEWIKTIELKSGREDGAFKVTTPKSTLSIEVTNLVTGLTLTNAANTIDGGTCGISYNSNNQVITITGEKAGKYLLITRNNNIGYYTEQEIENDYTEWFNSIEVISSTGSFNLKVGETIVITLSKWVTGNGININKQTTDGGDVNVGGFSTGEFQFTVQGRTAGKLTLILRHGDWGFYRAVPIEVVST